MELNGPSKHSKGFLPGNLQKTDRCPHAANPRGWDNDDDEEGCWTWTPLRRVLLRTRMVVEQMRRGSGGDLCLYI